MNKICFQFYLFGCDQIADAARWVCGHTGTGIGHRGEQLAGHFHHFGNQWQMKPNAFGCENGRRELIKVNMPLLIFLVIFL